MFKNRLSSSARKHVEVPLLLVSSSVLLYFGLTVHTITIKELIFWKHTFSILSGIWNLYAEKHYVLAIVIFLFSVIFPITKLFVLTALWFVPMTKAAREQCLKWLEMLGKWSMLDVFVVAVTVVITQMSGILEAKPHIGIYLFAASVILSMILTARINKIMHTSITVS